MGVIEHIPRASRQGGPPELHHQHRGVRAHDVRGLHEQLHGGHHGVPQPCGQRGQHAVRSGGLQHPEDQHEHKDDPRLNTGTREGQGYVGGKVPLLWHRVRRIINYIYHIIIIL